MIAKKHVKTINAALNSYAVACTMFRDADNADSRRLWAESGLDALQALSEYGITPCAGADIQFSQYSCMAR